MQGTGEASEVRKEPWAAQCGWSRVAAWRRCSFERHLMEVGDTGSEDRKKLKWGTPQKREEIKIENVEGHLYSCTDTSMLKVAFFFLFSFFLEMPYNDGC